LGAVELQAARLAGAQVSVDRLPAVRRKIATPAAG